jgi:predicted O-methyltransferase YrrM
MAGGPVGLLSSALGQPSVPQGLLSWEDEAGNFQAFIADIAVELTASRTSEFTEHAVEEGAEFSDHINVKGREVKFTINQTQTPILPTESFAKDELPLEVQPNAFQPQGLLLVARAVRSGITAAASAIGGALGLSVAGAGAPTAHVLQADSDQDRITELYQQLEKAQLDGRPITLITAGWAWERFMMTSVSYNRQGPKELGVFEIEAREIRTTSSNDAAGLPNPEDLRMRPQKNKGNRPSKDVQDAVKKDSLRKSLAAQGIDGLSAGF